MRVFQLNKITKKIMEEFRIGFKKAGKKLLDKSTEAVNSEYQY